MKKLYGSQQTQLVLTEKARAVYDRAWPLEIEEVKTRDGVRYNIAGILDAWNLSGEQVSKALEDLIS